MIDTTSPPLLRSPARLLPLYRLLFAALLVSLGLVVVVLFLRRLSGALVIPLEFLPAVAMGLSLSVGTWVLRRLAHLFAPESDRHRLLTTITVITWLLVAGVTLSSMSSLAILALWLPVIATEVHWRVMPREEGWRAGERASGRDDQRPPADVVQQLTRTRENGRELISGMARIDFAIGEQTAALHLAFCPPLESDPEVEVAAKDAAGIAVRATECRSYGLRLEAKRGRETASAVSVLVEIKASSGHS